MNSILFDIVVVIHIDGCVSTPTKYINITKFQLLEINYFTMNCESISNLIVDYIAQSAEIIITN